MSTVVILSVGVAVALLLPIAARVRARRFDPFEPIVVFALAWGVMFVVRPIAMVVRDDTVFYGVDISSTLDAAVLLGLIGAVGFVAGYEMTFGARLAARAPRMFEVAPSGRMSAVAVLVGVLAMTTFALYLVWAGGADAIRTFFGGRGPELNDILRDSPLWLWSISLAIVPIALVALAVAVVGRRASAVLAAALLVGLALVRFLPTGTRLYLLMLVGGAIVFLYVNRQRRPGAVAIALGLIVALVGSYALLVFRYSETRDSASAALEGLTTTPARVFSPLTKRPDSEMAPALAGALLAIPSELPHRYGAVTFGDLVTRPVPRQVWSGKPQPHILVVTEEVWPVARETGDFQPNFTPLLAFYWDFGLLGAFLGLALYGLVARGVYEWFLRQRENWVVQLVFALAVAGIVVAVRADPVFLAFHCFIMLAPVILLARVGRLSPSPVEGVTGSPSSTGRAARATGCATRIRQEPLEDRE